MKVLIFGGTTEGRELAGVCVSGQIRACICVASEYGEQQLPGDKNLMIHTGRLDFQGMVRLIRELDPELIFDATHPYADKVSGNVLAACEETGKAYQRVLRRESIREPDGQEIWVADVEAAMTILEQDRRPVLVTTGSKELSAYGKLDGFRERIYARVLPSHEGIGACEELGLTGSHMIAMQGPFHKELNKALLRQIDAGWLVTKESGRQGGFWEKIESARELGVRTIIIGRPVQEEGISLAEACRRLAEYGIPPQRRIFLVGIGMGSVDLMTVEAKQTISRCDAVIGAGRMLRAVQLLAPEAVPKDSYQPAEIISWLKDHPDYQTVGIMLSGDTGFYSGAKSLKKALESADRTWEIRMLPGISTLSYLCARLGTGWDDVYLCSMHGRACDLADLVRQHPRVFCLLGGDSSVTIVCQMLAAMDSQQFRVSAGEALSYPEERIASGTPEQIGEMPWGKLAAVLIETI